MNKFIKLLGLLLVVGAVAIFFSESKNLFSWRLQTEDLKAPTAIEEKNSLLEENKKDDAPSKVSASRIVEKNSSNLSHKYENLEGFRSCKSYFIAIDQMIISFFRRENFDDAILLLQGVSPPPYISQQLFKIAKFHNHEEASIIKNEMISKVIRIEKLSVDQVKIDEFLKRISRIQKYFYSPEFIEMCQP